MAVDDSCNIFLNGGFLGGIDFGDGEHRNRNPRSGNVFLAKLDPSGAPVWSRSFGSTLSLSTDDISVNARGNALITGAFNGSVDFGQGALAQGAANIYLALFDGGTGATLFSRGFAGTNTLYERSAVLDDQNTMVVTGEFVGTADFGGDILTSSNDGQTSLNFDMFVAAIGANGKHLWSRRFGDPTSNLVVQEIADGGMNSVVITGWVTGKYVTLGCEDLYSGGIDAEDADVFVVKLSSISGRCIWSKRVGDHEADQRARAVTVDADGNVIVVGEFSGSLEQVTADPPQEVDTFVLKYDLNGKLLWSRRMRHARNALPYRVAVDPTGVIALTGRYTRPELQDSNLFVTQLDASGNTLWSRGFGSSDGNEFANGIALDGSGNMVLAGTFNRTLDLGGVPLRSSGAADVFLGKFAP